MENYSDVVSVSECSTYDTKKSKKKDKLDPEYL
jgi:hypothetical protein